jgi:hypothetical protein
LDQSSPGPMKNPSMVALHLDSAPVMPVHICNITEISSCSKNQIYV